MWKPEDSLEDYTVKPAPHVTPDPPRSVSLQRTGEFEVLKPLTPSRVRKGIRSFRRVVPQPLWFRRFLVVGSGALVLVAFALISAILVGINEQTAGPDVAANENSDYTAQAEDLYSFDLSLPLTFLPVIDRSNTRRRQTRPTTLLAVSKPRPQLRPRLEPEDPDFVPTTLVIYAQNGVITSRIEPWLQASDK